MSAQQRGNMGGERSGTQRGGTLEVDGNVEVFEDCQRVTGTKSCVQKGQWSPQEWTEPGIRSGCTAARHTEGRCKGLRRTDHAWKSLHVVNAAQ